MSGQYRSELGQFVKKKSGKKSKMFRGYESSEEAKTERKMLDHARGKTSS